MEAHAADTGTRIRYELCQSSPPRASSMCPVRVFVRARNANIDNAAVADAFSSFTRISVGRKPTSGRRPGQNTLVDVSFHSKMGPRRQLSLHPAEPAQLPLSLCL